LNWRGYGITERAYTSHDARMKTEAFEIHLFLLLFSTQHCPAGVAGPAIGRATTLLPLGFSAPRTTPGLVGQTSRRKKPLFPGRESEDSSAIGTLNRLVLKTHWMTSYILKS
jgi:hypothetical protein